MLQNLPDSSNIAGTELLRAGKSLPLGELIRLVSMPCYQYGCCFNSSLILTTSYKQALPQVKR